MSRRICTIRNTCAAALIALAGALWSTSAVAAIIEWGPEDNPHIVSSNLVIGPGDLLRILPGTEVRVDPFVDFWIAGGRLEAVGTEADSILFTRNHPETHWRALVFTDQSLGNEIAYAAFEYASTDSVFSPIWGGAIFMDDHSTTEVSNSEFRHNSYSAVFGQGYSEIVISDCHIYDIGSVGIHIMWGASARVERSLLHNIGYDPPPISGNQRALLGDAIEFTGSLPDAEFHEIRDCVIYDIANDGVDLDRDIDAIITGNVIYDCADKGISVAQGSRATITNTLIYSCYWALGPQSSAVVNVANCTIYDCIYGLRAIIDDAGWDGAIANVKNLVIWNTLGASVVTDEASEVNATYCNFEDPYPGQGNISADPMFVDPDAGDFNLQAFSPCIDAGSSNWPAEAFDINGSPRVDDPDVPNSGGGPIDYYDMGVDEYWGNVVEVEDATTVPGIGLQILPHPADVNARARVHLTDSGVVSLRLFDAAGRLVRHRATGVLSAGEHVIPLFRGDAVGSALTPGIYFLRVDGPGVEEQTKIVFP